MISNLFSTVIYEPLYNALVALIGVVPFADMGIAVVILTILVKIILFPFARKAIHAQIIQRRIQPEVEKIRVEHKEDKQAQAQGILQLYKEHNIHPLSGIFVLLVQLPVIIGLYWMFFRGGLPAIDTELLYTFVSEPSIINMQFLSLIDMEGRSVVLAALAGITQFFHARIAMPPPQVTSKPGESLRDDMFRSLHLQMRYVLPVVIGVVAFVVSAAVALYLVTSNLFTIGQELIVRRSVSTGNEEN